MAEEGYVGTSERFLKEQKDSKTINSILKTRAQWPAHVENGAAPLSGTNLLANQNAPFFSFATMIGPINRTGLLAALLPPNEAAVVSKYAVGF